MIEILDSVGIEVIVALLVGVISGWIGGLITSLRKFSHLMKRYEAIETSVTFLAEIMDKSIKKNHPNDDMDIGSIVAKFLGNNAKR